MTGKYIDELDMNDFTEGFEDDFKIFIKQKEDVMSKFSKKYNNNIMMDITNDILNMIDTMIEDLENKYEIEETPEICMEMFKVISDAHLRVLEFKQRNHINK